MRCRVPPTGGTVEGSPPRKGFEESKNGGVRFFSRRAENVRGLGERLLSHDEFIPIPEIAFRSDSQSSGWKAGLQQLCVHLTQAFHAGLPSVVPPVGGTRLRAIIGDAGMPVSVPDLFCHPIAVVRLHRSPCILRSGPKQEPSPPTFFEDHI